MTISITGFTVLPAERDAEGHRTYKLRYRLQCSAGEGQALILLAQNDGAITGVIGGVTYTIPAPGETWHFSDFEVDAWAWCRDDATVTPIVTAGALTIPPTYDLDLMFSTKPQPPDKQRCTDQPIEDPLLQPPKVSGSFVKYTEEAQQDRFGTPVKNSAHEMFRGAQNEWDANRLTIKIVQNVPTPLQAYILPARLKDCVNAFTLWGMPPRTIKMVPLSFDRKYFGRCEVYYERVLEFEVRPEGFDRDLLDEGNKVLHGHWDRVNGQYVLDPVGDGIGGTREPNPRNPSDFDRYKDRNGENTRVVLDGAGKPCNVVIARNPALDPVPSYYISVADDNEGNPVGDTDFWVVSGDYVEFEDGTTYQTGDLPFVEGVSLYLIVQGPLQIGNAAQLAALAAIGASVIPLPTGLEDNGTWSPSISYSKGDYVLPNPTGPAGTNPAGYRHVEVYNNADFLTLGIPTDF